MSMQVEDFYRAFPYRLAVPRLFYRHTCTVRRLSTMQLADDVLKLFYIRHAVASNKSPMFHCFGATPTATAGVVLSVLCRFTKL